MLPPTSLEAKATGAPSTAAADSPASADLVKKILGLQDELSDLSYQVEAARLSNTTLKQENESLQQEIDKIKQQIAAGAAQQQQKQQQQQQQQKKQYAYSGMSAPIEQSPMGAAMGGPPAVGEKPCDARVTAAPAASSEAPGETQGPPQAAASSEAPEKAGVHMTEATV